MSAFQKKKSNTFKRAVEVFLNGDSQGDLQVTFKRLTQTEFEQDHSNSGDRELCAAVITEVGDIPVEGEDQKLTGQAAIDYVLDDAAAVSACFGAYIEAIKGGDFRKRGSRKNR